MKNPSPLRYPGGKFHFTDLISNTVNDQILQKKILIEPFCGGAGATLALLLTDKIESLALNDKDPLISSFWKIIFGKSNGGANTLSEDRDDLQWLLDKVKNSPINIDVWKNLRESTPSTTRDMAWKCLFMNRTSFNGIIYTAGPIGGWSQKLRTLDARFNRIDIKKKIELLWTQRNRVIAVHNEDWKEFCNRYIDDKNIFYYLDPPYYHKAEQLYKYLLDKQKHEEIKQFLENLKQPWLLSYDDCREIRDLYENINNIHGIIIDKNYSTNPIGGCSHIGRELFLSNNDLKINEKSNIKKRGFNVLTEIEFNLPPENGPHRVKKMLNC